MRIKEEHRGSQTSVVARVELENSRSKKYFYSNKMNSVYFFLVVAATLAYCYGVNIPQAPCGVNEAKYPCGRRCETRCGAEIPSFCKGLMCLGFACRCKNGYARNPETDQCVEVDNCPPEKCKHGEALGTCGPTCEGTCTNPFQPEICQRIDCRGASCRCDLQGGFVRNENTGECVLTEDCPQTD